jgi:hypothetical protein
MAPPVVLKAVRAVRTFSLFEFISFRTTGAFWICCAGVALYANNSQRKRMRDLYPDYDRLRQTQGAQLMGAKGQELEDIRRYNDMVRGMRNEVQELKSRASKA